MHDCGQRAVSSFNTQLDFQRTWVINLLKTLWKKEKMLVTSIFSCFHNVLYPIKDKSLIFSFCSFVVRKCVQSERVLNVLNFPLLFSREQDQTEWFDAFSLGFVCPPSPSFLGLRPAYQHCHHLQPF